MGSGKKISTMNNKKGWVGYISAVYTEGKPKGQSYLDHINSEHKNINSATQSVFKMEKDPEFIQFKKEYLEGAMAVISKKGTTNIAKMNDLSGVTADKLREAIEAADNPKDIAMLTKSSADFLKALASLAVMWRPMEDSKKEDDKEEVTLVRSGKVK